jgi:hypothetical protein
VDSRCRGSFSSSAISLGFLSFSKRLEDVVRLKSIAIASEVEVIGKSCFSSCGFLDEKRFEAESKPKQISELVFDHRL